MNFDFLVAGAYFTGWKLVRSLPEKFAYSAFEKMGVDHAAAKRCSDATTAQ
jgi:hypothetical protein